MFHFKRLPVSAGLLAIALAALPAGAAQAAETTYPLTINSCGHEITFKQAPAHWYRSARARPRFSICSAWPTRW